VALGGQGAPIVPIGEKYLLSDYEYFLNLGGIANISCLQADTAIAFDICPANRVLNMLASLKEKPFDEGGELSARGKVNQALLDKLNGLDYYAMPYPKSLANDFGTEVIYPMIMDHAVQVEDGLRTYTEHIAVQLKNSMIQTRLRRDPAKLLVTGGGAFNHFLVKRISELLAELNIEVIVPDPMLVNNKEAIIMAFIGVLRWRQEINVMSSVTGASRDSAGGALWAG
jgi:anhydro-N-acetylmuramic acid kinase